MESLDDGHLQVGHRVGIGDVAPDFCLPGTGDRHYALSDYRGQPVVLVFYPGDATPVCTRQLNSYNTGLDRLEKLKAQVLALSPQGVASHERFSCEQGGFSFPLLADTTKEVGRTYGVLSRIGFYRRSVFVVDGQGIIRYAHRSPTSLTYRPIDELVEVVETVLASTADGR